VRREVWVGIVTAVAWAASFCGGIGTGIGCWPLGAVCVGYFGVGLVAGTVLFLPGFLALAVFFSLVFRIRLVRALLLRPFGIVAGFILLAMVGYIVAPHGIGP